MHHIIYSFIRFDLISHVICSHSLDKITSMPGHSGSFKKKKKKIGKFSTVFRMPKDPCGSITFQWLLTKTQQCIKLAATIRAVENENLKKIDSSSSNYAWHLTIKPEVCIWFISLNRIDWINRDENVFGQWKLLKQYNLRVCAIAWLSSSLSKSKIRAKPQWWWYYIL